MTYPVSVDVHTPEKLDRWRPIGQWVLALPHLLIAAALEYVAGALALISWFAILFTGRLPKGLADFQVMILRYTTRVELYASFLYDDYPPFDFTLSDRDPGGSPVRFDVVPELENRNRLTVALRLLWAIPALVYALVIAIVGVVCWIAAFFAIIVTGRWPEVLRSWAMKLTRISARLDGYMMLLTDEYPPFTTEQLRTA